MSKLKRICRYLSFTLVIAICAELFTACGTEPTDLVSNMVTLEYTAIEYDGEEKKPSVSVMVGETEVDAEEYTIEYSNNKNVGTASVKISASDDAKTIKGTINVGFEITKATAAATTLDGITGAIDNENFGGVNVTSALTINQDQKLSIPENFVINFGDNLLTNNGEIVNNGTIIQNKGIDGVGTIENNGEIIAEVDTFTELKYAFTFASTTKLVADIGLPTQSEPDGEFFACNTAKYETITLDINGHTLRRALNFNAEYNVDKLYVINSSENEAIVDTIGLNDCAIYFRHNQARNTAFDAEISNITFKGDNAAVKTNGMCKADEFNISFKNCKFDGTITTGAYLPAGYNYRFEDCSFTGITAYYAKSGQHDLINCEFVATKNTYDAPSHNGNGCDETGSALIIDSSVSYHEPLIVNINGGKFESKAGYAIEEYATSPSGQFNFYSEVDIKNSPSFKFGVDKVAVAVPTLNITDEIYNLQDKVDEILEKVSANYSNLENKKYSVEELKAIIDGFEYYVEIGEVKYIESISSITVGNTNFDKNQIVNVSVGNNNFVSDKAFKVEDGRLFIGAPILLFEYQNENVFEINGKEFELNIFTKIKQLAVTSVNYRGEGNSATAVAGKTNEFNLEVSTAGNSDYLEIYYSNVEATDLIITRKENNGVLSYGLTGVEAKDGNPLGYFVVGWHPNPAEIPTTYDGATQVYSFYVIGKGQVSIRFNIDLVNVD